MSILVGRGDIYDMKMCKKQLAYNYHMTVPITRITDNLADILKDLGLKVKRPLKKNIKICRSLWARDQSICVNNKIYLTIKLQSQRLRHILSLVVFTTLGLKAT